MRNLWVFNHYAVPPSVPGGTRHYDFSRRLVEKGWDVSIFASGFCHRTSEYFRTSSDEPVVVENIDGVRFIWLRTRAYHGNGRERIFSMLDYSRQARLIARNPGLQGIPVPDAILGCSVHPLAAWTASQVAKMYSASFYLELRDLWPQSLIEMGAISRFHPAVFLLRYLEKILLRRATSTIVLSPKTRDYLVCRGVPEDSVHLIPNGVDLSASNPSEMSRAESSRFIVMYLGAHGIANQLDVVIEAAQLLGSEPDIRFVLVGSGPEKSRLMEIAQSYGLTNIEFLGAVNKAEVPAVLSKASALLLTEARNVYGSSNKLYDYLAAGRPLILSSYAEHNLASKVACGVRIEPGKADALADAVMSIRELGSDKHREMGQRARRYVELNNDWDKLIEQLIEILENSRDSC